MYNSKFVVSVLVDGRPMKEYGSGEVSLPFGSSYTLRFINKNDRAAVVRFSIDGENVSGGGYRIPAHDRIDIRRHADRDRAFRFVSLESDEARAAGKDPENSDRMIGVIEARFYLEKKKPDPPQITPLPYPVPYPYPYPYPKKSPWNPWYHDKYWWSNEGWSANVSSPTGVCRSLGFSGNDAGFGACSLSAQSQMPPSAGIEGATVEGHKTGQSFSKIYMDLEDDYVAIKVVLRGYHAAVATASEDHQLPRSRFCEQCGQKRINESANFCGNCGHKL